MPAARKIKGYFGEPDGRTLEGPVMVTFTGGAKNEMLSMAFEGQYQVTVSYRVVERLVSEARLELRRELRAGGKGGTYEFHTRTEGFCTDGRARLRRGESTVWFRSTGSFEMLTMAWENRGQISVPFAPILALTKTERSSFA